LFSKIVRAVRDDTGLTQEELASLAKVSRRSIARWEADASRPSPKQATRLVAALWPMSREIAMRVADETGVPREAFATWDRTPDMSALDARILDGVVAGADALDIAAKRMRAALAITVSRWKASGITLDEVAARLGAK
jgi:transcriptional regulator with XRE-family HTH domain